MSGTSEKPEHNNAARRLYRILLAMGKSNAADDNPIAATWASGLGLNVSDSTRGRNEVLRHLMLLHEELDALREGMRSTLFPETLYRDALAQVDHALSTAALGAGWKRIRPHIQEATMLLVLQWCAQALPNEEPLVGKQELEGMLKDLESLRATVAASGLPDGVQRFILREADIIERAIREYPVRGAVAFNDAVQEVDRDFMRRPKVCQEHGSSEPVQQAGSLLLRLYQHAEKAGKLEHLLSLGERGIRGFRAIAEVTPGAVKAIGELVEKAGP